MHRTNVSIFCSTLIKQRARWWIEKQMEKLQIQRDELQAELDVIRERKVSGDRPIPPINAQDDLASEGDKMDRKVSYAVGD